MKKAFLLFIFMVSILFWTGSVLGGPLFDPSYSEVVSFLDGLPQTGNYHTTGLAHDGTYYWSVSGGSVSGNRLAQMDGVTGNLINTFSPGFSFRSVFTDNENNVFVRVYSNRNIYKQTTPGNFQIITTLVGGSLDSQSAVVFRINSLGEYEYIAQDNGTVSRWSLNGSFLGTTTLQGYGNLPGETSYPPNIRITVAIAGDYWLTYSQGILSAWDNSGDRIDQTVLTGAGSEFDSHFSLSYCNGMVFINDGDNAGMWRGYDVGLSAPINTPPVACIVGGDRTVDANTDCQAVIILDGSCSTDIDSTPETNDDIVSFDWYWVDADDPNIPEYIGNGEIVETALPAGNNIIILEVVDGAGASSTSQVLITVNDITPPELEVSATPSVLWPPNHKMVEIQIATSSFDNCGGSVDITLLDISVSESDDSTGDGHTENDIQIGDDGSIWLRAERSGLGDDRVYTITYQALDNDGNVTVQSATVTVPHNNRGSK